MEWCGSRAGARWPAVAGAFLAVLLLLSGAPARGAPPVSPDDATGVTRFEASSDGATVELNWRAEPGRAVGFRILRALEADGPYAPINAWLIQADPTGAYRFVDPVVDPGATYHYKLEVVDPDGVRRPLGPLTITVMPEEQRALRLPGAGAGAAAGASLTGGVKGGCVAGAARPWRDAAALPLVLLATLLWRLGRRRRSRPGP